jgi:hypothetical protein
MQNKANFPHFSPKNKDFIKNKAKNKPNSKPILGQYQGCQSPNKPNFTTLKGANFRG